MFSQACVKNSVPKGGAVHTPLGRHPPPIRPLQLTVRIPLECILVTGRNEVLAKVIFHKRVSVHGGRVGGGFRNTVNVRPVRILLECILVFKVISTLIVILFVLIRGKLGIPRQTHFQTEVLILIFCIFSI